MPSYDQNKVREYMIALRGMKDVFRAATEQHGPVQGVLVDEYETLLNDAGTDLPGLLRTINKGEHFSHDNGGRSIYYRADGIKAHIERNIGILQAQQESDVSNPVTEPRDFSFIGDEQIRAILSRDYEEVQRAIISRSWKSAIILSGGSIEAILLDLLTRNADAAKAADAAPTKQDLQKWDLSHLIDVAVEIELVDAQVANLGHSVRMYRNLIHPGVEVRTGLKVEPEEANIAFEVLKIIIRELS